MHGLPQVAVERLARAARSGVRTSLLSAPSAAGIKTVGLEPVGEVMGCTVQNSGFNYQYFDTGYYQQQDMYQPYLAALRTGYETALDRMRQEAVALGADGVVDVRLSATGFGETSEEYLAMGTAVRAQTSQRPGRLFSTELSGSDVAKLMLSGWVPVQLEVAIALNAVYRDYSAQVQTSLYAGNTEVDTFTRLVNTVRAQARQQFQQKVRASHADGGIVSAMTLSTWNVREIGVAALATVYGTTIVQFRRGGPAAPDRTLTIMPLRRRGE